MNRLGIGSLICCRLVFPAPGHILARLSPRRCATILLNGFHRGIG